MQTFNTKINIFRHILAAFVFLLGCHVAAYADPISGTLISLAISAAVSTGTAVVSSLLAPKPKPIDKNRIAAGEVQTSFVSVGAPITEIYGQRQSDSIGGIKCGGNYFYLSDIRKKVTTTTQSAGGGGKGGVFGAKKQTTNTYQYYQDIGLMVGRGPLRILQINAGTDVLYKNYPKPSALAGTIYQAENGVRNSGTAINDNNMWSGGKAVATGPNAQITFTVAGDGKARAFYFDYYADGEKQMNVAINGTTQTIALPPTFGRVETVMVTGATNNGATTVFVQSADGGFFLDKLTVGETYVAGEQTDRLVSGGQVPDYENPFPEYDHINLRNPLLDDWRAVDQFNYQPNRNAVGETEILLPAGCTLRIYEGNSAQLPDPVIQAHYAAQGLGAPAYRERCYIILENFETTKYSGATPQISVIAEHLNVSTLAGMYEIRSKRVGLKTSEYSYAAFDNIPLRGYAINNIQSPKTEMEIINRAFDIDMYESREGIVTGVVPDETVSATLNLKDLDAQTGEVSAIEKPTSEILKQDIELPRELSYTYFDPGKDFELGQSSASREVTVSKKSDSFETGLVLTAAECRKMVDRDYQKIWAEKDTISVSAFYRSAFIDPTALIKVQHLDKSYSRMRVKAKNNGFPGVVKLSGVTRNLLEPFPRVFNETQVTPISPTVIDLPGHIIGTLIDVAILRSNENTPGIYAACARTDEFYQWKGAGLFWERETGYEQLATCETEAIIGRTVSGGQGILPAPPSDYEPQNFDTASTVTFDLFHGAVETISDAAVNDRSNVLLVGNELIAFANAVRVAGYPNRWTVSHMRRFVKGTGGGHSPGERVVLLNDAVKWIPLDVAEFDQTRHYKFVSGGQDVDSASRTAFTWSGQSKYNTPGYQVADTGTPVLDESVHYPGGIPLETDPVSGLKQWVVKFPKPKRNGASITDVSFRMLWLGAGGNGVKNVQSEAAPGAQTLTINNADGFPPSGRITINSTGETMGYTGIENGGGTNKVLTGLVRGLDNTEPRTIPAGDALFWIPTEDVLGNLLLHKEIQRTDDYLFHYKWRNKFIRSGIDGWSNWLNLGEAKGSGNPAPPPPIENAPPADPVYPPEREDPNDPIYQHHRYDFYPTF